MEENFINRLKKQIKYLKVKSNTNGITMVALVVTILVLIIITSVSIGALYNDDGIFRKASMANEVYNREKARTALEITLKDASILKYSSTGLTNAKLNEMLSEIGTVIGDEITIDGFTYTIDRNKLEIKD